MTERFPGLGGWIKERLKALRYWKNGKPDISRFCRERGYDARSFYPWLKGRVPTRYLSKLAKDLETSEQWLLHGGTEESSAVQSSRVGIPTLAEVARDPDLAVGLPFPVAVAYIAQLNELQTVILERLREYGTPEDLGPEGETDR